MNVIWLLFVLCSPLRSRSVSVVFDFNASHIDASASSISLSAYYIKMEMSRLLVDVICVLFLLSSHLRLSLASALFDFNASLIDVAPVSPILLSVDLMKKNGLLMDVICVLFLLSSRSRLSSVSVVFDFNASLNDVAPLFLILFPVFFDTRKSAFLMDIVCVLFFIFTSQIELSECCV